MRIKKLCSFILCGCLLGASSTFYTVSAEDTYIPLETDLYYAGPTAYVHFDTDYDSIAGIDVTTSKINISTQRTGAQEVHARITSATTTDGSTVPGIGVPNIRYNQNSVSVGYSGTNIKSANSEHVTKVSNIIHMKNLSRSC